jgi:4,5-dihydroxyphthalate decarboxylase
MAETSNRRRTRFFATGGETRLGEQKTLLIISSIRTRNGIEWSRIRWKEHGMNRVKLTIATTDYDHFRDFRLGLVNAEGIDHTWLTLGHHEIFARFTFNREWDVSELSFAKFIAQVTRKDSDIIGLPVVCSRLFRFSSFYVNKKSKINNVKDLKGKSVGSPEWAHTAAVYMRGWLTDEHGIGLKDIHWYQAGANEAGRIEKVELKLPKGMNLTRIADKSLSELLARGEIDCALIARSPDCFRQGHPDVVRLFPNYWEMEQRYYRQTKVWPIMHIIAVQKHVLDENPWVARNLLNAFVESKRRSLERILDPAVSRYPLPWLSAYASKMRDMFEGDPFPYGIEENRPTIEQFLRYTYEQGIAKRHAKPEEIFPKGVMTLVRV